jgi:hypothetical protein
MSLLIKVNASLFYFATSLRHFNIFFQTRGISIILPCGGGVSTPNALHKSKQNESLFSDFITARITPFINKCFNPTIIGFVNNLAK